MQFKPFPLPSRPLTEITFRAPTVRDSMEYIDIPDYETEKTTTKYLNALQVGELNDSALWTQQDRRTALWWIFVNSRDNAYLTYQYGCGHCNDFHFADVDMSELVENLTVLNVPPVIECVIPVEGERITWKLVPLDGRSAEMLEYMNFQLPQPGEQGYEAALTELRLAELALMTRTDSDPVDYKEAADHRLALINRMELGHEFPALVARIQMMVRDLKHGLDMEVEKKGVRLNLPKQACKATEKGEPPRYTALRAPFRNSEFISRIRSEWMDNNHQ
ncbi:hypothetical protein WB60_02140 [bacteria symbiont BFo2 of Frankliniella occidentalis]|nr:hypothetical protein WB60_02140 [bacteria symbiont BFo2 of Frankliniella occidentalis]